VLQEQDEYPSAKYGTFPILEREKAERTSYLKTENNLWGGRISKFHAGADMKQNQCLLPFPRTTKMNVLGHHYFAQKHPETSQIKFKLALHSLLQGFGLSGGHPTFGDEPLTPIHQTFFLFDCLVSPPTPYLWMEGLTKPPLVA
jgi:hypothetical protein